MAATKKTKWTIPIPKEIELRFVRLEADGGVVLSVDGSLIRAKSGDISDVVEAYQEHRAKKAL